MDSAGGREPWAKIVLDDLHLLQRFHSPKLDDLGDPHSCAADWARFVEAYPSQWKEYVIRPDWEHFAYALYVHP